MNGTVLRGDTLVPRRLDTMKPDGREYAFEMAASRVRVGAGVTREVGMDRADMGARLVMVLRDPRPAGPEELARLFEDAMTAW